MAARNEDLETLPQLFYIQVKQNDHVLRLKALATNIYRYEGQQWRMIHRHSRSPSEEDKEEAWPTATT